MYQELPMSTWLPRAGAVCYLKPAKLCFLHLSNLRGNEFYFDYTIEWWCLTQFELLIDCFVYSDLSCVLYQIQLFNWLHRRIQRFWTIYQLNLMFTFPFCLNKCQYFIDISTFIYYTCCINNFWWIQLFKTHYTFYFNPYPRTPPWWYH